MKYVKRTFTEYTGGGFYVDFVELSDGRCIGISEECIVIYPSFEHFMEQDCYDMPYLPLKPFLPAIEE